jgi:hypothetical protein
VSTTEPVVLLDPYQVEQLRHLLGAVEDWLLHCSYEVHDDLTGFLTALAWASSFTPPQRLVPDLITELGQHTMTLRAALQAAPNDIPDTRTGPPA